ncbi:MAG TPA: hypothetical protein PLV45_16230, partial [bacterium]|nr:hypothetical protein [bacterium]
MSSDVKSHKKNSSILRWLWGVYLLISIIYVFAGAIHLDEGAYMYAANAVYRGQLLYQDFFFLQPPLHSYIFGLVQLLFHGLLFGRLTSVLFGIASTLYLMRLARSLDAQAGQTGSRIMLLALMAATPFQLYFFTITRLYALTAFFISAGCYYVFRHEKPTPADTVPGTIFLALAVGTRLTVLPLLLLVLLYLLISSRTHIHRFIPVAITIAVLSAVYIPFVVIAGPDRLWFNLLGMNLSLHSHNLTANLVQKARATRQLIRYYFLAWILLAPLAVDAARTLKNNPLRRLIQGVKTPRGYLWLVTLTMLLVHSTAKLYQVSYQTIIMPLLFCLLAVEWRRKIIAFQPPSRRISGVIFPVICVLSILAYGRTSISIIEGRPALMALWEQEAFIREHTEPGQRVFSADSALAVIEADRDVLKGMAASDLFAGWSTEKCTYFNVLNFPIMEELIRDQAGAMVIYGDLSFNLSLPFLEPIPGDQRNTFLDLIDRYYSRIRTFPNLTLPGTRT